jgi:hypothetical protein
LQAAFSREEQSDVAGSNPHSSTAGSASPPCMHNIGYGRSAPRALLTPFLQLYLLLIHQILQKIKLF